MRPAKKNLSKALSALSMAAAAVMATQAAHAATLTMYYGNEPATSGSPYKLNGIYVSSTTGFGTAVATQQTTGINTGSAMTISMPVGDYLSLAIDAVLTGVTNADGGRSLGGSSPGAEPTQPTNLGLAALGVRIPSSDTAAASLQPVEGALYQTFGGLPAYYATPLISNLNAASASAAGAPKGVTNRAGSNGTNVNSGNGNGIVPTWGNQTVGDVETGVGEVGTNIQIDGINSSAGASAPNTLGQFGGATAAYSNATEFFDSLQYHATSSGTVTLSPAADTSATNYWVFATAGTTGAQTGYNNVHFSGSDTAVAMQQLVIVIGSSGGSTGHAIVSLTAAAPVSYGSSVGSIAMQGSHAAYAPQAVTGLNNGSGYLSVSNWNPATDVELFGVDVQVGGQQASAGQLATLINAINGSDGKVAASSGVTASLTPPSPNPFGGIYNLFLTDAGGVPGGGSADALGLDLSSGNDSLLSGYTFAAVSVVPEPMSLGLLALGGVGLMTRRNRRKA